MNLRNVTALLTVGALSLALAGCVTTTDATPTTPSTSTSIGSAPETSIGDGGDFAPSTDKSIADGGDVIYLDDGSVGSIEGITVGSYEERVIEAINPSDTSPENVARAILNGHYAGDYFTAEQVTAGEALLADN